MELDRKRPPRIVPEYSLTGDLLSYRRCAMQYRYYNGSALPPSRPVQMWYGEFIHGVLEAAFRLWRAQGGRYPFPWPCTLLPDAGPPEAPAPGLARNDLRVIGWPIEEALVHAGKRARSRLARISAYRRATAAVNLVGPHLFPLISDAEQRVIGTRSLASVRGDTRADRYALHGIIDVLTHQQLGGVGEDNVLRTALEAACPGLSGEFEVIVDYKGSRRPETDAQHYALGEWQVQTYAWLRGRQQLAAPVAAGVLIYLNELAPGAGDMHQLQSEVRKGSTDVVPSKGDADDYAIRAWAPGAAHGLSLAFRYRRAIRVIPVDAESIRRATSEFDSIVTQIEDQVLAEEVSGSIRSAWPPTCVDPQTCAACDFRFFCPKPAIRPPADAAPPVDDEDL